MSTINSVSGLDPLAEYRVEERNKASGTQDLGQNEFMELLVAQLENQNPLEPQDNGAFISQLAEFSALEEMQKVSTSVDSLASQFQSTQALQASSLVGRGVLVPANEAPLGLDGRLGGVVDLEASTSNLNVTIFNRSGELVKRLELGQNQSGLVPFEWDGTNENGETMPDDVYTVKASTGTGEAATQASTLLSSNVDSVSIGKTGSITLNLSGMGSVPLEDVREIN